MNNIEWEWKIGRVDTTKRFFELKYGYDPAPVARIGIGDNKNFLVEFLLQPTTGIEQRKEMFNEIVYEIELYLINNNEPDPLSYMINHTYKCANIYSRVHWRYYPNGSKKEIVLTKESRIKNFSNSFLGFFAKEKITTEN